MTAVLHDHLPFTPWADPALSRLPGIQPMQPGGWPIRDNAFAGQMAQRDRLVDERRDTVLAIRPGAGAAVQELLQTVRAHLSRDSGYALTKDQVRRPDGVVVGVDDGDPLATLGRLVQDDLCVLQKDGDEHVLTAACLCFPASWSLAEKIGRPLTGIHTPVKPYDRQMAQRVQRLFDMIRPEQPLWRANWLIYSDPDLHQPRRTDEVKPHAAPGTGFMRSERQTLFRLPETGAVVFAIHTYVVPLAALSPDQVNSLNAAHAARENSE